LSESVDEITIGFFPIRNFRHPNEAQKPIGFALKNLYRKMIEPNHPYCGAKAVIATKHNKGILVAPAFSKHLDLTVEEVMVDTDELGTFSGEIERVGSVREVVIKKAELGMAESGSPIGIASEGSIGADPLLPFINSDIEYNGAS